MNAIKSKGKYHNRHGVRMTMDLTRLSSMGRDYMQKHDAIPPFTIPREEIDTTAFRKQNSIIWLGHSTILGHIDGISFIVDPMLSDRASPINCMGPKRFEGSKTPIEQLPKIDIILITHNHYDHLDKDTILALQESVQAIYVPLDNKKILTNWGIDAERIREFDWFEQIEHNGVSFAFCPTQHFSGRSLSDRDRYLWGSWAILGSNRLYVSGDSGYNDHFNAIAQRYEGFDIACLECGAYNENWKEVHMSPEQSVQASIDLNAKVMLPMHWSAFDLSTHTWDEPISRAISAAKEKNVAITTPYIGAILSFEKPHSTNRWWQRLK